MSPSNVEHELNATRRRLNLLPRTLRTKVFAEDLLRRLDQNASMEEQLLIRELGFN